MYTVVSDNGGNALKIETVSGGDATCSGWIIAPQTDTLPSAYVRFDAKVESGGGNLRWFLLLENEGGTDQNYDTNGIRLRLPQNAGVDHLAWNRADAGDTVAPDIYSGGDQLASTVKLEYGQWACYELFYDENSDLVQLSINDRVIPGLVLDNDASTGFDQRWLGSHGGSFPIALQGVRIGFGGSNGTTYVDNLVVSESPIGCN